MNIWLYEYKSEEFSYEMIVVEYEKFFFSYNKTGAFIFEIKHFDRKTENFTKIGVF